AGYEHLRVTSEHRQDVDGPSRSVQEGAPWGAGRRGRIGMCVLFECTSPPEPLLSPLAPPPTEWYDLSGLSASWGPSLSSSPDELAVDPFPTVLCHELVVPSEPSERAPVPRGPRGRRRPYRHAAREG